MKTYFSSYSVVVILVIIFETRRHMAEIEKLHTVADPLVAEQLVAEPLVAGPLVVDLDKADPLVVEPLMADTLVADLDKATSADKVAVWQVNHAYPSSVVLRQPY